MKRHGNLYSKITEIDNIREAYVKASKGKHWQKKVQLYDKNRETWILKLKKDLEDETFRTAAYMTKEIYEPKKRTIYILPFYPDRIVHHAILNILEPIWEKTLIKDTYACIKGRGQQAGSTRCMEMVRRNKYCLKCDISKFYPSVDHDVLKKILIHKIKDPKLIKLLFEIIDSTHTEKNVPIGNYLSQWFGNMYLNELDMQVKHKLRIKNYIRYCDDFCLFSNDKDELRKIRNWLRDYLENTLLLRMSKCDLFPVSQGVDFLGYRHFPKYILVRKRTAKRIKKHLNETMYLLKHGRISKEQARSKVASAKGWIKHANSHNYAIANKIDNLWKEVNEYEPLR